MLVHGEIDTDLVSGVTYAGVAMTRRVTVADTTGASIEQRGRSYIYTMANGVTPAPGPQSVVVTRTGTAIIAAFVWTQTGNQVMEVLDSDSVAQTNNPTLISLSRSGRASLAYLVLFSGVNGPANLGTPTGFSRGPDHDFGDYSAAVFRENFTSTVDVSHQVGQADGNSALCGITVAEAAPPAPPSGNTDHCCGAECGITGIDIVAGATAHWNLNEGAVTSQTARARHGGRAYRFAPVNQTNYIGKTLSGGNIRTERFYLYFDGALPDRNCTLYRLGVAAGEAPGIGFRLGTSDIVGKFGTSFTGLTNPQPVQPNTWYRVELLTNVSVNPNSIQMRVCAGTQADPLADGASIDWGTGSQGQAATTFNEFRLGAACFGPATAVVIIDDHLTGSGSANYPFGPSTIVPVQPASDGTHSYNAAGDFRDATADLGLGATTAWQRLIGLLIDMNGLLQAATAAAGEYLELNAGGAPAMSSVRALEMVSVHKGATTAAHKQTLRWLSGANSVDVFTDLDFSELTLIQHSKHYLTMPGGAAFTVALLNASKWRFASSFTSVLTGGQITGLMMEVDGVLTGPPPPPPPSGGEGNPIHLYPAPGIYTATLTVADDDGLTDSASQEITVT